jgi:hypothetical protein
MLLMITDRLNCVYMIDLYLFYVLTSCKLKSHSVLKNVMSSDNEQLRQDSEMVNFLIL